MTFSKILVTGGAGFIGANFIRYIRDIYPEMHIVNLDKLTYAANLHPLDDFVETDGYEFVQGDICDPVVVERAMAGVDAVVHFAAESHVDRSIADPDVFAKTNLLGTQVLLSAVRRHGVERYLQISTDEVYGTLGPQGYFTENSPLAPNSPYAASKAGADLLVRASFETYGLPVLITRCSNNYGPYQYPEKLIPTLIGRALRDQPLPLYGDGQNVRDWLYVEDHCQAIDLVLHRGTVGQVYNIGGHNEWTNREMATHILRHLHKSENMIEFVPDRLGHDRRYAIDASKITQELGWHPQVSFAEGLASTVNWYVQWFSRL